MMKTRPSFCTYTFAKQKKKAEKYSPPLDRLRYNESTEAFFLLDKDKKLRKIKKINDEKLGFNHSILVEKYEPV